MDGIERELKAALKGEVTRVAMDRLTSFRIGGEALVVSPEDGEDLVKALQLLERKGVPWRVLGGGTNLLVSDRGIAAVVLDLRSRKGLWRKGRTVGAEAGVPLAELLRFCAREGLSGLEALAGIPGTVGGAVKGNAGSGGTEVCSLLRRAVVVDRQGRWREEGDLRWGYRQGPLQEGEILWEAVFELREGDPREIEGEMASHLQERRRRQPLGLPSAGCIFKNPPGMAAGRLIEEAGLKGKRRGGAMISEVHANFIVNAGGATFDDVMGLIEEVREEVLRLYAVELELEVQVWT